MGAEVEVYRAGNLFGVWEQLKLGAYYRRLFILCHYKFAVGVLPTSILKPLWKTKVRNLDVRSFYGKSVFNCASFGILKSPVVCVQHKGGSDIRTYPNFWVLLILKVLLESEGDYWPSLNGPFMETPSPEAPVSVKQRFAHVDAPDALWEGDFFLIKGGFIQFWHPFVFKLWQ